MPLMQPQAPKGERIPAVELLAPRARDSWTHTRNGDPRGYIDADRLKELWIHTGTACNLACPFCLEGSHPGDGRIPGMKLSDVKPFIHEAIEMGVEQFSFTGGEPFVIRDFVNILNYASQHRPCFVLTNATEPLLKRRHQVLPLLDNPYPIHFRVSLDFPDRVRHDKDRGTAVSSWLWRAFAGSSSRASKCPLPARPIRAKCLPRWSRRSVPSSESTIFRKISRLLLFPI